MDFEGGGYSSPAAPGSDPAKLFLVSFHDSIPPSLGLFSVGLVDLLQTLILVVRNIPIILLSTSISTSIFSISHLHNP